MKKKYYRVRLYHIEVPIDKDVRYINNALIYQGEIADVAYHYEAYINGLAFAIKEIDANSTIEEVFQKANKKTYKSFKWAQKKIDYFKQKISQAYLSDDKKIWIGYALFLESFYIDKNTFEEYYRRFSIEAVSLPEKKHARYLLYR